MQIKRGRTSQTVPIRILDTTSVIGGGKTGLVYSSANLTAYYKRELDASATAITLATMTTGTWATGGFVEEDATHLAGQYELGLPNAALGSGDASTWVEIMVYDSGTGLGIASSVLRIDLVAYDPQDATRLGLTALPNANAEATGGLYTRGSGAGQINQPNNGLIDANVTTINAVATTSVTTINANVGTTQPVNFTGTGASALAKADAVDIAGTASAGVAGYVGLDWSHINAPTTAVDLIGTTIKNVDNAIANVTAVATTTNLTNAPTAGDFTAAMKTSLNAATPAVTVSDKTGFSLSAAGVQAIWDALTNALTTAGSIGKLLVDNINATISSRLATTSYTAPDNATIAAIHTDTGTIITNQTTINSNVLSRVATASLISDSGTAQAGSTTSITLRSAAPAVSLIGQTVFIQTGTGAGQSSSITAYNTSTKAAATTWTTAPDVTSTYVVIAVQGGSSSGGSGTTSAFSGAAATQINAIQSQTNLITAGGVTVTGLTNLAQTTFGSFIPGNDYYAADGSRGLTITSPYPAISLLGSTVTYRGKQRGQTVSFSVTGNILSATQVNFDFPADTTSIMQTGFASVEMVLASGHTITIAWGQQLVQNVQGL